MSPTKRVRKPWLVGGSVLSVAVLAFGTLQGVGLLAHQTEHTTHTAISSPIHRVDVSGSAQVGVVGTDGATVTIDTTISRGLIAPSHSESVKGDRLVVSARCPVVLNTWCRVAYAIRIPRGLPVTIRSSGGGITVSGVDGDLDLSSSGGGITVNGGRGSERLESSGGGIRAQGVSAATVEASSSGGGVHLSFTTAPTAVTAESSGGGVTIDLPDTTDAYQVEASSSGGSTHTPIRIDPTSTRMIKAHSSGGGVSVSYSPL